MNSEARSARVGARRVSATLAGCLRLGVAVAAIFAASCGTDETIATSSAPTTATDPPEVSSTTVGPDWTPTTVSCPSGSRPTNVIPRLRQLRSREEPRPGITLDPPSPGAEPKTNMGEAKRLAFAYFGGTTDSGSDPTIALASYSNSNVRPRPIQNQLAWVVIYEALPEPSPTATTAEPKRCVSADAPGGQRHPVIIAVDAWTGNLLSASGSEGSPFATR